MKDLRTNQNPELSVMMSAVLVQKSTFLFTDSAVIISHGKMFQDLCCYITDRRNSNLPSLFYSSSALVAFSACCGIQHVICNRPRWLQKEKHRIKTLVLLFAFENHFQRIPCCKIQRRERLVVSMTMTLTNVKL